MDTNQLINELKSRGYYTELLFCREDVLNQLKEVNEGNVDKIVLTDEDMDDILDSHISVEWICERVNESIYNGIINDFCES